MTTYALRKFQSPTVAAEHLGVTVRTVHRFINKWGIKWKKPNEKEGEVCGLDEEN